MELKDTIELMTSENYKERFKAEYLQLKIRVEGLRKMLIKWDAGKLDFTPAMSKSDISYSEEIYGRISESIRS